VFSVLMQKINKSFLNTYTFIKIFLYNPTKLVTLSDVNEIRTDKNPETKKKTKFSYFLFYIGKSEMVGLLSSICILFASSF
jgi:hypothetical protein